MSLDLISDLWSEIKRYVTPKDRSEVADIMLTMMMDHDYSIDEIRAAFRNDTDVKRSLAELEGNNDDDDDDDDDDELYFYND